MDSRGWLARVFGTEGAPERPRKKVPKDAPRVEKRSCGNCRGTVAVAAHRCPHCGYRLAQPNPAPNADRSGRSQPEDAAPAPGLTVPLLHGATVEVALTGASGA